MILTDIQKYLESQGRASLAQMELKFRMDSNALRGMLNKLIRKGRVRKMSGEKCGGCASCAPEAIEFYEWVTPTH